MNGGICLPDIQQELILLSDENYRKFSSKLLPNNSNILGVKLGDLRKIAKREAHKGIDIALGDLSDEYFEELMLQAFVISYSDICFAEKINYIERFLPKIDNWSVCDSFCSALKGVKNNRKMMFNFLKKYFDSENEFECRFSYVILIRYYIDDEYIDDVFTATNSFNCKAYYAKMAVAWLLAEIYIDFKERAMEFMTNSKIDKFVINKAIQKICESNRVSAAEKIMVRNLKR